jgi:hypothetical protein
MSPGDCRNSLLLKEVSSRGPKGPVAISDTDIDTNVIMCSYSVRDCHVASLLAMTELV